MESVGHNDSTFDIQWKYIKLCGYGCGDIFLFFPFFFFLTKPNFKAIWGIMLEHLKSLTHDITKFHTEKGFLNCTDDPLPTKD